MELAALAFGAHADDIELACGGTLITMAAQGRKTGVIALTRGEMATRGSAEIRAREFEDAASIMGLAVHRMLDIPDARIEETWENKMKVVEVLREFRPGIVLAPYWIDRHPDHEHASQLVRASVYLSGLKSIETSRPAFRPSKIIFYQSRYEFPPSFIVDISIAWGKKMEAIRAYRSQFPPQGGETPIAKPEFLDFIETRDKRFGAAIGAKYGEPFLVREAIRIEDPVAFFGTGPLWTIP